MDKIIKYSQITMMIIVTFGTLLITYLLLTNIFGFLNFDAIRLGPVVKIEVPEEGLTCLVEEDDVIKVVAVEYENPEDDVETADNKKYLRYKLNPLMAGDGTVKFVLAREIPNETDTDTDTELNTESNADSQVDAVTNYETVSTVTYNLRVTKVGFNTLCANIYE